MFIVIQQIPVRQVELLVQRVERAAAGNFKKMQRILNGNSSVQVINVAYWHHMSSVTWVSLVRVTPYVISDMGLIG